MKETTATVESTWAIENGRGWIVGPPWFVAFLAILWGESSGDGGVLLWGKDELKNHPPPEGVTITNLKEEDSDA